jgi:nuclear transport factor 2 (NTF2) superfamily protein
VEQPRSTAGVGVHGYSQWRNRDLHITGRGEIVAFLTRKWQRELDYVLRKSLWDFHDNRIAVRFQAILRYGLGISQFQSGSDRADGLGAFGMTTKAKNAAFKGW